MEVIHLKKIMYAFFLCLLLVGCSASGESNNVTMDSYVAEFEDAGLALEENKPIYSMIGAKDGVIFYNEGQVIKIYEFDSEKAIKEAEKTMPVVKEWQRNGLFLLETSNEKAIEIFNSVK